MNRIRITASAAGLLALATAASGCFGLGTSGSAVSPTNLGAGPAAAGGSSNSSGALNSTITGQGSMFTPTSAAVVGRIQKVLGGAGVNCNSSGNCNTVLKQLQTNLPSDSNPVNATGLDQIPLLVYAACADATPSTYSVNTGTSVASNMTNLVNAGVSMVNQHVGNLAAADPLKSQVAAVFTTLVNSDVTSGATTAMTFISVCLAANTFGVAMTGF